MTLSDDVAELERRCAAAEKRVSEMIDDPTIDYIGIYVGAEGIELEYCIKDWEGDFPRISLHRELEREVSELSPLLHPEDMGVIRTNLMEIEAALGKHLRFTREALSKVNALLETAPLPHLETPASGP